MKGKWYTTEQKIRVLREAEKIETILDVYREQQISERTFHRWKREFGMMGVRVHRARATPLAYREEDQDALHRAVKPLAELIRGELQRKLPRGMFQLRAI